MEALLSGPVAQMLSRQGQQQAIIALGIDPKSTTDMNTKN